MASKAQNVVLGTLSAIGLATGGLTKGPAPVEQQTEVQESSKSNNEANAKAAENSGTNQEQHPD